MVRLEDSRLLEDFLGIEAALISVKSNNNEVVQKVSQYSYKAISKLSFCEKWFDQINFTANFYIFNADFLRD